MSILGDNLKSARKALMLSQLDVADILRNKYNLKSDRVAISKWETGFQVPNIYTLKCLAEIYGVSLDALNDIPSNNQTKDPPRIIAASTGSTDGNPIIIHSEALDKLQQKKNALAKRIKESEYTEEQIDKIEKMIDLMIQ